MSHMALMSLVMVNITDQKVTHFVNLVELFQFLDDHCMIEEYLKS